MWRLAWWKDVAERAIAAAATSLLGWMTVAGFVVGFEDLTWPRGLSLAGVSALAEVLRSIGTHKITGNGPSFNSVYKDEGAKQDDDSRS